MYVHIVYHQFACDRLAKYLATSQPGAKIGFRIGWRFAEHTRDPECHFAFGRWVSFSLNLKMSNALLYGSNVIRSRESRSTRQSARYMQWCRKQRLLHVLMDGKRAKLLHTYPSQPIGSLWRCSTGRCTSDPLWRWRLMVVRVAEMTTTIASFKLSGYSKRTHCSVAIRATCV